ncbi:MAG: PIF1 family ATP-dependent DNA helicase [Patescibacteria group bacterium]|nr:PIF1 family ATP-dependent DNA helicase [Patescibacteria group bacterium]
MNQAQALKILKSGQNIFLTGSAGTGKTFLLNEFIEYLKKENIKVSVTASTGIAATHLDGITIHSWSGMGIESKLNDKQIKSLLNKEELRKKIKETKILIIDEISMLDAARLDLLDQICRAAKEPFFPFGGLQIIMCGDFFQLPPVNRGRVKGVEFAYDSLVWKQADIRVCYLDKKHRQQNDLEFIDILDSIRGNDAGMDIFNKLKIRLNKKINCSINPTKLYTHNLNVDTINDFELSKIRKEEEIFYMDSNGPEKVVTFLKKNCLAPEELKLKIGAIVMFVKNNFRKGYVNGTLGEIIGFNVDSLPIVRTKSGEEIVATLASWEVEQKGRIVASISQIPLRLAWAITVHKSQGMSLDAAEIDLSKSFECGMGYVALSRVRRLDSIKLMGINQMALRVDEQVVEKDKEFKELSGQMGN